MKRRHGKSKYYVSKAHYKYRIHKGKSVHFNLYIPPSLPSVRAFAYCSQLGESEYVQNLNHRILFYSNHTWNVWMYIISLKGYISTFFSFWFLRTTRRPIVAVATHQWWWFTSELCIEAVSAAAPPPPTAIMLSNSVHKLTVITKSMGIRGR